MLEKIKIFNKSDLTTINLKVWKTIRLEFKSKHKK